MKKDVFINGHKWLNIIKDCKRFLNKIKELKRCLIKLNENGIMKNKMYLLNCIVKRGNCQPVIVITDNEYTFLANDSICKT